MIGTLRPAFVIGVGVVVLGLLLLAHSVGLLPGGIPVGSLLVIGIGAVLLASAVNASPVAAGTTATAVGAGPAPSVPVSVELGPARSARLVLGHGAGSLHVRAGAAPGLLVDGRANRALEQRLTRADERVDARLQPGREWQQWPVGGQIWWYLALARGLPIDLEVRTGASQVRLDLSELDVPTLKLQTGASDVDVTVPARGHCRMSVSAGAASIRIHVPQGAAASVRNRSALAGFTVDQQRFPRVDGRYESPGFSQASDWVEIDVDGGLASFAVV